MVGVLGTVTSTGTMTPFDPGALMAMAALNGPAPCRAEGFTVTCNGMVRLPEVGTLSQFPPSLVTRVAVNVLMPGLVLETLTGSVIGILLFAAKLKLSEVGLVESGLGAPDELALN